MSGWPFSHRVASFCSCRRHSGGLMSTNEYTRYVFFMEKQVKHQNIFVVKCVISSVN